MFQHIVAILIVAATLAYVVISTLRKPKAQIVSKCDGCKGCDLKNMVMAKKVKEVTGELPT